MFNTFGQSDLEQGTLELIVDQLEELVVTIIEEIRERPGVAAAILAAVVGAFIGTRLAAGRRRRSPPERVVRNSGRAVGPRVDLMGIGMQLMQNPMVRSFAISALTGGLRKRVRRR